MRKKLLVYFLVGAFVLSVSIFNMGFSSEEVIIKSISEEIQLPIIMYHNVLKSRKGKYIVSPKQLERDFIAIKEAGYTTVFLSEVISWVDGKGELPDKPLVLTFDDGHYNNIYYALPLAKEHGIKFMINPVTSFSKFTTDSGDHSNPNYSHLTWSQMREAHESGHVEIGNHTHALHKFNPRFGIMQVGGEDLETYLKTIRTDIEKAQDLIEASGTPRPMTFAYPFGKFTKEGKQLLIDMGFRAILTCTEGVSTIKKGDASSLYHLKRYNRDGWESISTYL